MPGSVTNVKLQTCNGMMHGLLQVILSWPLCHDFLSSLQGMDIVMHGGEYYDGDTDKMLVYGDLFVYSTSQGTWKHIITPGG